MHKVLKMKKCQRQIQKLQSFKIKEVEKSNMKLELMKMEVITLITVKYKTISKQKL
jgi:hypothetical protein